ncbi:MAG: glycosyl hydrolase [Kiritimatiellaeota bacterium]|nr:glycosyl hydrolase [Kiritimatiellota bacterium]
MKIRHDLTPAALRPKLERFWLLSAQKIRALEKTPLAGGGAPVFTVRGRYTARGWTEWTQGFQFGAALLQFDVTGEREFLELGQRQTVARMAPHLTHFGVHDHGFNNVSTYGNLWRLMNAGRIGDSDWERNFYELALKVSGAVQAQRWTSLPEGGYIHSFNGPHSLFADTIRSLRSLALAYKLGHELCHENDRRVSLLERLIQHAQTTVKYNVYFGKGRDNYDTPGRVAHESIFNLTDGCYRCPSSQQGFSPFTTWTRGLAWILLGCTEQLEFIATLSDAELKPFGGHSAVRELFLRPALATADYYIEQSATDGIPYWDTGAPGLAQLGDYLNRASEPFNDHEPVDSSAAAIAAQGLLRLGHLLGKQSGRKFWNAGLTVLNTLLDEPYVSTSAKHQGLILHSVYHRPKGWDYVPRGQKIPCGESSMWGDYHAREAALLVQRVADSAPYYTFFGDRP